MRPIINRYILNKWQEEWNMCKNNKLYGTNPEITNRLFINFKTRLDQVVYTRCRVGHTSLTHGFLLKGEDPTLCMFCKIPLSVKHILLDCPGLITSRMLFYKVTSLKDIFNEIMPEKVLEFLSCVNLKNLI